LVTSLRIAKDLRTRLTDNWTQAQLDNIFLFIACLAIVVMLLLFVAEEHELSAGMVTFCVPFGDIPHNNKWVTRYFHGAKNNISTAGHNSPKHRGTFYLLRHCPYEVFNGKAARQEMGNQSSRTRYSLDYNGNPHNLASRGTSRSRRTSTGRFRVDFTLITQWCSYCSVQYLRPNAKYQVLRRLGTRARRSSRLH
jgi:hypothetical protein